MSTVLLLIIFLHYHNFSVSVPRAFRKTVRPIQVPVQDCFSFVVEPEAHAVELFCARSDFLSQSGEEKLRKSVAQHVLCVVWLVRLFANST